jgi:phosphomannomutase
MTVCNRFIFDVDGTLTPSRKEIDKEFRDFFIKFQEQNFVYLVTGSDRDKTLEQVGNHVYNFSDKVYNCSGSDTYQQDKNIYTSKWKLPELAEQFLTQCMNESEFVLRTGLHFEHRPGMCNFSVVGRNATLGERKLYVEHDVRIDERNRIAKAFCTMFPDIDAKVGGETGIDIFPKGSDKSQILRDFDPNDILHFFGDAMHREGNDYPLKKEIIDKDLGFCYNVKDYNETWKILRDEFSI